LSPIPQDSQLDRPAGGARRTALLEADTAQAVLVEAQAVAQLVEERDADLLGELGARRAALLEGPLERGRSPAVSGGPSVRFHSDIGGPT
jgi:hypothetical protein